MTSQEGAGIGRHFLAKSTYLDPDSLSTVAGIFDDVWRDVKETFPAKSHANARDMIAVWIVALAETGERRADVLREAGRAAVQSLR